MERYIMKNRNNKNTNNYETIIEFTTHFTLTSSNSKPININKMTGNSSNNNENNNENNNKK